VESASIDVPNPTTGEEQDSSPMRILLVSDYYAPDVGGAERQTQLLAHELRQRGHQVEVATIWSPGLPSTEDDGGVMVHRMRQLRSCVPRLARAGRHSPTPFPDPVTVAALRRIIRRLDPEVIHSYGWLSYACAAASVGRRTALVVSARDYAYGCATRTLLYRGAPCSGPRPVKCLACASSYFGPTRGWAATVGGRISWALLRRKVTALHSISRYVQRIVVRDFLSGDASGIPHVVIPSFAEDVPARFSGEEPSVAPHVGLLPTEPFIMYGGSLRAEKGIGPLLQAYRRLEGPPSLVLIGSVGGDVPADLPPGVHVLPVFPHDAIMVAWSRCLFGVAPSLLPEPLGSVVYEGMSVGKAMIGTVPGGHADMIEDGVTGRLVPAGDVDALAEAMRELIEDDGARERFGRAAGERASTFTAAVAIPQFEALYRRARYEASTAPC
jgi:glycosyltransferase involved in cell wall biosynthesis